MKQDIKKLSKYIHDELNTAETYIECAANKTGDEHDIYKALGKDELSHAEKLINLADSSMGTLPLNDQHKIIWEYLKENFKDRHVQLKAEWSMID